MMPGNTPSSGWVDRRFSQRYLGVVACSSTATRGVGMHFNDSGFYSHITITPLNSMLADMMLAILSY